MTPDGFRGPFHDIAYVYFRRSPKVCACPVFRPVAVFCHDFSGVSLHWMMVTKKAPGGFPRGFSNRCQFQQEDYLGLSHLRRFFALFGGFPRRRGGHRFRFSLHQLSLDGGFDTES